MPASGKSRQKDDRIAKPILVKTTSARHFSYQQNFLGRVLITSFNKFRHKYRGDILILNDLERYGTLYNSGIQPV
jgi:hypothetical protein